jgi:hypothetical protein
MNTPVKNNPEAKRLIKIMVAVWGFIFLCAGLAGFIFQEQVKSLLGLDSMMTQILSGGLIMIAIIDFVVVNTVFSDRKSL